MNDDYITFKAPEGFSFEGLGVGAHVNFPATFRILKDGMLHLVTLGKHKMPGYHAEQQDLSTHPIAQSPMSTEQKDFTQSIMDSANYGTGTGVGY